MHFYDSEQWNRFHLSESIERFIYLRWEELFDERTYLSWQIRTSDLCSICDELLDSIDITCRVHSHHPNILHLIEELDYSIHCNNAMLRHAPQIESLVRALKWTYDQKTRNAEVRDVVQLRSLLKKTRALVQGSKEVLLAEIKHIATASPKEKKRLDNGLSLVASLLLNEGYSYFYLKNLRSVFERSESFRSRLDLLRRLVSRTHESYVVHFLVKVADPDFGGYESHDSYTVLDRDALSANHESEVDEFLSQDRSGIVVSIAVGSLDQYSAISEAKARLQQVNAPIRLYKQKSLVTRVHERVLVLNPKGEYRCYNERRLRFPDADDSSQFRTDFESYLRLFKAIGETERLLLNASLKYFGVSLSSTDDEIKFLNLWIALESLYQESDGESIISRIRYSLPHVICSNYVCDTLREIAKDIRRNCTEDRFSIIESDFPTSSQDHILPSELFTVVSDVKDGEKITRLLEFASNSELLVHRINLVWESFFQSREAFLNRLGTHQRNVDWQILRLYRIRNSIMHKGKLGGDINYLMHHLNHYYRILIHKCINHLKEKPTDGVLDALLSIREDFEFVKSKVRQNQEVRFGEIHTFDPSDRTGLLAWPRQTQ